MSKFDLSTALDDCISCLQHGMSLEKTLERYPGHEQELRPLVETAGWMHNAGNQQLTISPARRAAQARSRRDFVRSAYFPTPQERSPAPDRPLFPIFHLRLATSLIIFAILIFVLLGGGMASVSALPGDAFYPVKLALEQAQVDLAATSSQRIQLQENYDQRRSEDVSQLKGSGRLTGVDFSGLLARQGNEWEVASIRLEVTAAQSEQLSALEGMIVEVIGSSNGEIVQVKEFYPRQINFSGRLTQIQTNQWTVDGVKLTITDNTQIDGNPVYGSKVEVTAGRLANGQLQAITIVVSEPGEQPSQPAFSNTEQPKDEGQDDGKSQTPAPKASQTASPEPTDSREPHATEVKSATSDDFEHATATPRPTLRQDSEEHQRTEPARPSATPNSSPTRVPTHD